MIWNFKAMSWCFNNGIKIFPQPILSNGTILKIVVSKNENETLGTKEYSNKNVYKKINELYIEIYNKNNSKNEK